MLSSCDSLSRALLLPADQTLGFLSQLIGQLAHRSGRGAQIAEGGTESGEVVAGEAAQALAVLLEDQRGAIGQLAGRVERLPGLDVEHLAGAVRELAHLGD